VNKSFSHETCREDSTAMVQRLNRSPGVRIPYQGGTISPRRIATSVRHISLNAVPGQTHNSERYPMFTKYPSILVWPHPCRWGRKQLTRLYLETGSDKLNKGARER